VNRAQAYVVSALRLMYARFACSAASRKIRLAEWVERDEPAIDEI